MQLKELQTQVQQCLKNSSNGIGHIGTQNIIGTQTNNIYINAFGQENIQHLTDKMKKQFLFNFRDGIPKIIKDIHFNPEHPENQNIRQLSHKQNKLQYFDGKVWLPCDRNNTLDKLIDKGYKLLFTFFTENQASDDDIHERAETFLNYFQNIGIIRDQKEYQYVKREVYMLLCQDAVFVLDKNEATVLDDV